MKYSPVPTMTACKGRIDSFYHGSALDGEGLRSVVFFSGCNLRCPFCHNPETLYGSGSEYTVDEVVKKVLRYKTYYKDGGVTLSGGEPMMQAEFCAELVDALHGEGMNVIAETNGTVTNEALIKKLDGVRVDVKNFGGESGETLVKRYSAFLSACEKYSTPVTLTNVLIPEVNDGEKAIVALKELKNAFPFASGVEFLPFRKLCVNKYAELGIKYPYEDKREATKADVTAAYEKFVK